MIKISYHIDQDLRNYRNSLFEFNYPTYGRNLRGFTGFLPSRFVRELEQTLSIKDKEKLARKYLSEFRDAHSNFIDFQTESLHKFWRNIEPRFVERLETYTNKKIKFDMVTCYLTTLTISPYDTKDNSFMVCLFSGVASQINTMMHEFMHLAFLHNFGNYCLDMGVSKQSLLEINEALVVLLGLEFADLSIVPGKNEKPAIEDLQKEVEELWRQNKKFAEILERLIGMRRPHDVNRPVRLAA